MRGLFLSILIAVQALAGEYAVLSNGFTLHVDSHEAAGGTVRLHMSQGTLELPSDQVVEFRKEDYVAPPVPVATAVAAQPVPPTPKEMVTAAAKRAGLPPGFVQSVAKVESGYRLDALSPKGAIGIMQLMPATAAAHSADARDPQQNVDAGAMHLRELLVKYDGDVVKALAAYNAGSGAVDRYKGLPPYPETQTYVQRVLEDYGKNK